jgi:hypothetical protein
VRRSTASMGDRRPLGVDAERPPMRPDRPHRDRGTSDLVTNIVPRIETAEPFTARKR